MPLLTPILRVAAPSLAFVLTLMLSLGAWAMPTPAGAQRVLVSPAAQAESNVPKWLRGRPWGITVGYDSAYEGSGELGLTINLAADYGSAQAARSPLQSLSSIDIPVVSQDWLQLGISANLWGDHVSTGPREGLDYLYPSLAAGVWGSVGVDSIALDAKILGKLWSPEIFPTPREGFEGQLGLTLYAPLMRLGGGRALDLAVRGDVTFADDAYMSQHFGISASEAARSGLSAYTAGAGLKSTGLSLGAVVPLSRNFELQGAAGLVQLLDDAAQSPWVTERGKATDIWGNVGVAFRF